MQSLTESEADTAQALHGYMQAAQVSRAPESFGHRLNRVQHALGGMDARITAPVACSSHDEWAYGPNLFAIADREAHVLSGGEDIANAVQELAISHQQRWRLGRLAFRQDNRLARTRSPTGHGAPVRRVA